MQTDTRIAFEGLVLGLYKVGALRRRDVHTVLHAMENHAHDSRSLGGSLDIEMLLFGVMEALPGGHAADFDGDDDLDDEHRVLTSA